MESNGKYELLDRVGIGGMAEVFRARPLTPEITATTVVVKRILPHLAEDPEFRSMFMDEAKIAAILDHPNIVKLLDLGREGDELYLVLEYVDGADLFRLLHTAREQSRRLPLPAALEIMMGVLQGLHYAHNRKGLDGRPLGIVHRDVGPGNILVSYGGSVKLTDFGVAKATNRAGHTVPGVIKGNLPYMAPEQIQAGPVDARTDVYGAGLLLHAMVTGHNPFEFDPLPKVLDRVMAGDIPPPSMVDASLPRRLDAIIATATAISLADRYGSALKFQLALQELCRAEGIVPSKGAVSGSMWALLGGSRPANTPRGEPSNPSIVKRLGPLIREEVDPADTTETGTGVGAVPDDPAQLETTHRTPHKPRATPMPAPLTRGPALARGEGVLGGHKEAVSAVAVSPDGLRAVSASHDLSLKVWDLVDRRELATLKGHKGAVTTVAVSADGSFLASGSRDRTVRLWHLETGNLISVLEGHTAWVFSVSLSRDGRHALSGSFDRSMRLWDLASGKCVLTLQGHRDTVAAVALSHDGKSALSGSYDRTVKWWDLAGGSVKTSQTTDSDSVRAVCLWQNGPVGLSGGADGVLRLWNLLAGEEIKRFNGHLEPIVACSFSPDGKLAASASYDGSVRLWSIATGAEVRRFNPGHEPVMSLAFGPDGSFLVTGGGDRQLAIWDLVP